MSKPGSGFPPDLPDPLTDDGQNRDEQQHRVRITKPFYLGAQEVTQAQYQQVMGTNPSQYKDARNPVETVSWDDAVKFCDKLSALPDERAAGRTYRLPTEAEWEYACRAGTTTRFSFGDDAADWAKYALSQRRHLAGATFRSCF